MKNILLLSTLLIICFSTTAQTIRGKVVDSNNATVEFATVVLQTPDSVFVSSAYTDSLGMFSFKSDIVEYRLVVQHLMYEGYENSFSIQGLHTIQLKEREHNLNEVIIKGERPLVSVVDGRMTYDMPRLMEGKVVSNAYESLLQLPGVREQDGALVLAGASSLNVIINGKPTTMSGDQLMQLLKSMPKERVQKAEVMYSAPPQFHIRGAAINLVLYKNDSETPTLQGQVNAGYEQRIYDSYSAGTTLLYSTPKYSADFLYSFNSRQEKTGMDMYSHHLYNESVHDIEQFNTGRRKSLTHNVRLGNDFNIDEKNKLSLVYTGQVSPSQPGIEKSQGTFSNSVSRKNLDSPIQMHNALLSYSSGFGLDAGVDYTFYRSNSIQNFEEKMIGKENTFVAFAKQEIDRVKTYADQRHNLASGWEINYGGMFMYASDKGSQTYSSPDGKDLSASNSDNKLREYTYNLYGGVKKNLSEKLSVSASITGEYYKHGNFDEWSLFPSAEITYVASPLHIIQMSLSTDKDYPSYWEMNDAIGYLNGYSEIHGNPLLRPYKDYEMQLSYILKSKYIVTLYGSCQDDYFAQLPYQSSSKLALIYKTLNFDYKETFGINIVAPFNVATLLNSRITLNGYYSKVKSSNFHDISFNNDKYAIFSQFDNTINVSSKPNIKLEVTGTYTTTNIQGPSDLTAMWKIDAGVKWIFANEKAELRLKGNDIFRGWNPDMITNYAGQNIRMNKLMSDFRSISLSFSYKFGDYKEKKRKSVDTSRFGPP